MRKKMTRSQIIRIVVAALVALTLICVGPIVFYSSLRDTPVQALNLPVVPAFDYFTPAAALPAVTNALPAGQVAATPTQVSIFVFPAFNNPAASNTPLPQNPGSPAGAIPPTANGLTCKNILYPARPGQEWIYRATAGDHDGNVHMKVISLTGSQATLDVLETLHFASVRTLVQCDRDIVLNFPALNNQILVGNILNGLMKADYVSGVLAPNEAAFVANNWALSWSSQYLMSGSGNVKFHGRDLKMSLSPSLMTLKCQTLAAGDAAFQNVTVPAGTFHALKVVCLGEGQVIGSINGVPVIGRVSAQSTQWFAPYVGLVKMQSDFANIDVFGIVIPLNESGLTALVELQSYVQAP